MKIKKPKPIKRAKDVDHVTWNTDDGQPPAFVPLIGLRVKGAWLLPSGCLFLLFEGRHTLMAEGAEPSPEGLARIDMTIGKAFPDADFADLDDTCGYNPYTEHLRGMWLE